MKHHEITAPEESNAFVSHKRGRSLFLIVLVLLLLLIVLSGINLLA